MNEDFYILDSIKESAAVIDSDGFIIFVNKAWKLFSKDNDGNPTKTNVGINYLSICDRGIGDEADLMMNASSGIRKVIAGKKETFELEYPCHSPFKKKWFTLRASKLLTDNKLTLVLHIDITKRKLVEIEVEKNNEKIQIINERLNSAIYKIVHDIQSPLNSIIGIVNLSKKESDIGLIKTYMDLINKSSINLNSFINETLHYISSSSVYDYLDFNVLLQEQLETIEPLLKENSIEIRLDLGENNTFHTNPFEFRSVFANILTNALKYSDPKKAKKYIDIFFRVYEDKAILKIKDNGIGIREQDIPRLFEHNFQINKNSSSGVGLGLFMVKKSIILLEGSISVNSTFKIETEFTVEVPNK